jgi:hypothetical protein
MIFCGIDGLLHLALNFADYADLRGYKGQQTTAAEIIIDRCLQRNLQLVPV